MVEVATTVDPRFKDLKYLPRSEREEVWWLIKQVSAQQPNNKARESKPPKKKMCLLVAPDSEYEGEAAPATDL